MSGSSITTGKQWQEAVTAFADRVADLTRKRVGSAANIAALLRSVAEGKPMSIKHPKGHNVAFLDRGAWYIAIEHQLLTTAERTAAALRALGAPVVEHVTARKFGQGNRGSLIIQLTPKPPQH